MSGLLWTHFTIASFPSLKRGNIFESISNINWKKNGVKTMGYIFDTIFIPQVGLVLFVSLDCVF